MNSRTRQNFKIMEKALKTGSIAKWDNYALKMQTEYLQELLDMEEESMTFKESDWCEAIIAGAKAEIAKRA